MSMCMGMGVFTSIPDTHRFWNTTHQHFVGKHADTGLSGKNEPHFSDNKISRDI